MGAEGFQEEESSRGPIVEPDDQLADDEGVETSVEGVVGGTITGEVASAVVTGLCSGFFVTIGATVGAGRATYIGIGKARSFPLSLRAGVIGIDELNFGETERQF
jgi:hypothetical protein